MSHPVTQVSPLLRRAALSASPRATKKFLLSNNHIWDRPPSSVFRYIPRRSTSTFGSAQVYASSATRRIRNIFLGTSLALVLSGGYLYITDTRASVHRWLVVPFMQAVYDAEDAHHAGVAALKTAYRLGLHPRERIDPGLSNLQTEVLGTVLDNPIGISGGLDKDGEIISPLFALGNGVVEIGGVTPLPQDGNAKPRVFRIPSKEAVINRYGLNSEGSEAVALRLRRRLRQYAAQIGLGVGYEAEEAILNGDVGVPPGSLEKGKLLAVQIAKNRDTPEGDIDAVIKDYVFCIEKLAKYADIIVVNVSSPNTAGLRKLQNKKPLSQILTSVVDATKATRRRPAAVMVKVSPDEDSDKDIAGICDAVFQSGADGVIVANTTKRRPNPFAEDNAKANMAANEVAILREQGGYSGPDLFPRTVSLVKRYRKALDKRLGSDSSADGSGAVSKAIFASGGLTNGQQALEVLNAGASVAMVYTAFTYGGVGTITRIKQQMDEEISKV